MQNINLDIKLISSLKRLEREWNELRPIREWGEFEILTLQTRAFSCQEQELENIPLGKLYGAGRLPKAAAQDNTTLESSVTLIFGWFKNSAAVFKGRN